ncbi:hypothetical protein GCM10009775_28740 [Microbacterium aoyamense]|uniref:Activator of Hsp90 ATPase homologue 1/2-like C-terminal domain-containing protein n=1 Tax=Microbacterium aoyamense TaxID=344166 RepID=A0ABN2PW23_9MICO|nr:SRPBCC family protein [Microbacterium aoyamense]
MTDPIVRALTGDAAQQTVSLAREYRAAPAEVWHAITTPERIARILGALTGPVPTAPGDVFHIDIGGERVRRAELMKCAAPYELAYTWWSGDDDPGSVRIRLTPTGDGTRVTITHDRLRPHWTGGYGAGWEASLAALAEVLGSPAAIAPAADWSLLQERPLELTLRMEAPRDRVWDAWTTSSGLATWWWSHWTGVEIIADVRVGGAYRFAAPAQGMAVAGEYLVVDPLERLAFTWVWSDDDGVSVDEAVEVMFAEDAGGTALTVRHTGPWPSDEPVESYRQGWEFVLGALRSAVG